MDDQARLNSVRQRAAAQGRRSRDAGSLTREESRALVDELDVYQSELEVQNEELRTLTFDLEAARDRYRDLFDFSPISYVVLDADGKILEANLAAAGLFGCTREELLHLRIQDFISSDHQDRFYLYQQAVLRNETGESCEILIEAAGGHSCYVAVKADVRSESNRSSRVALLDISERVEAARALLCAKEELDQAIAERTSELAESRQFNEKIAETVPLPLWIFDFDSKSLIYTNRLTRSVLGYSDETLPERIPILELIDPQDLIEMEQLKKKVDRDLSQESAKLTFRLRSPSGGMRWISTEVAVFERDDMGQLSRILGVSTDITERRATELQMLSLEQEARIARERERRDLAAMLHDSVGQLLPLANAKLALACRSCDDVTRNRLSEVERLIREAHTAASSLTFRLDPPALHEIGLVQGIRSLARELERDHGLGVTIEHTNHEFVLSQAVEFAVYRVVHELLVNVAKHAGVQQARLGIIINQSSLRVIVEDRGRGFLMTQAQAAGLGLRSAKERLNYLGCRMFIQSELKRGTRVELRIPLAESVGSFAGETDDDSSPDRG